MEKTGKYLVAIVGRPNVGKSTLFNRLVGSRQAILSDIPGTTRDVLFGSVTWGKTSFAIADTAGIESEVRSDLEKDILAQTQLAIDSADLILFLADAKTGLQPDDKAAAALIRRLSKPVILVINKAEGTKYDQLVYEFHQLGLGDPQLISAIQGRGIGDILDELVKKLKKIRKTGKASKLGKDAKPVVRVSILGRPNVGKSTLFNQLIGSKRAIVSNQPGTTRDAIVGRVNSDEIEIEFTDTAGLRRPGKIGRGIEYFSSLRALRSLQNVDIALLLMEADEGVIAQDMKVVQMILSEDKGLILVINKWDAVEKDDKLMAGYERYLSQKFPFIPWAPRVYVSALTGQRADKIIATIKTVWQSLNAKIPNKHLNQIISSAVQAKLPTGPRKIPKIYFSSIKQVNPPTITLKVNYPEEIHFSYLRYLEKKVRDHYPLIGAPLRWEIIKSSNKI
ncbi:ribosome biogenesis GTPase Der [candidate division Kazan bacterium RIFCSPHIGHO2_01_FULL_49_10]|uniref:GTPase Der n=1 Tax=candidate division Kazan bacterium RIFCSPLOWO2_01_FULL_48_13 TaxID=1798539 RepID=A0A1F4PPN3_UNCK3|nr:MAG: ribosome biogenesis GTPase Der [candidate division Kazan bacterium RIFCSPHIGHO2_01_FULL_49_10]OGB85575.1 MAG: ribosome biogenesis GTPase Der [candidate division Kazan bacterium RIFCSPLOWO2_01_FULL_48_13]